MDADRLAMLAGVIISLAFSYIPQLQNWYDKLASNIKRLIMLGLMAVIAGSMYGLACAGIVEFAGELTCDRPGLVELIWAFFYAAIANQTTYALSPREVKGPYYPARLPVENWTDPR